MSESKRATVARSDKPLTHDSIGWDPDDAPELDDAWFAQAEHHVGETLIRRGNRAGATEDVALPREVIERFRAGGPDWRIRIESALKEWMAENPERI